MGEIQPPCKAVCLGMPLDPHRRRGHLSVTVQKICMCYWVLCGGKKDPAPLPTPFLIPTMHRCGGGGGEKVQNQVTLQHEADFAHIAGISQSVESKVHCRKSIAISISTPLAFAQATTLWLWVQACSTLCT